MEVCSSVKGDRHRRKLCGHCNELLSYSAYNSHKALYYNESTREWKTEKGRTQTGNSSNTIEDINIVTHVHDDDMDTASVDLELRLEPSQLDSPQQETVPDQLEPGINNCS